jgi:hypothetical protein
MLTRRWSPERLKFALRRSRLLRQMSKNDTTQKLSFGQESHTDHAISNDLIHLILPHQCTAMRLA